MPTGENEQIDPTPNSLFGLQDRIYSGFVLGFAAHVCAVLLLVAINAATVILLIGLTQLLWLWPLETYLGRRGLHAMRRGVHFIMLLTLIAGFFMVTNLKFGGH